MAFPITILKNILNFNRMHIEKCETTTVHIQTYGVVHEQTQFIVHARPFKRSHRRCPKCGKQRVRDGHRQEQESRWRAPNLNGIPVYILYRPHRILCPEHGALNEYIQIENSYPDLYRAYQLKESLRLILHMKDPEQAQCELARWVDEARASGLKPMCGLADKISRHEENILNAIKYQANSAKSESTNTTIKGLIRLARGFRNIDNMIALIYLKCSDIVIPLCNRPQPTAEYLESKRQRANELRRAREEQCRLEHVG